MNTIKLLIILYSINLFKNLLDFNKVLHHKNNQNNTSLQSMYIIKFFILSLFQILIIYLLFKENDYEAKPLILISYGIAIPLYTIDYMNKLYNESNIHLDYIKNIFMFFLQCITSTLAIYIIWSKKSILSFTILIFITLLIMFLPILFLKKNIFYQNITEEEENISKQENIGEQENIIEQENISEQEENIIKQENICEKNYILSENIIN